MYPKLEHKKFKIQDDENVLQKRINALLQLL